MERAKIASRSLKEAVANEKEKRKVERVMADRPAWERVRLHYRVDEYGDKSIAPRTMRVRRAIEKKRVIESRMAAIAQCSITAEPF